MERMRKMLRRKSRRRRVVFDQSECSRRSSCCHPEQSVGSKGCVLENDCLLRSMMKPKIVSAN